MFDVKMKKVILLSLTFLIVSLLQSNAQNQKFYVQSSYDQVVFSFSNVDFHSNSFSYRVGGFAGLSISKHVACGFGINFEMINYSVNYPSRDSPSIHLIEEIFNFSYISFPLMIEVEILNSKSNSLLIQSGFELNSLIEYDYQKLYSDGDFLSGTNDYIVLQNSWSFLIGPAYRYFFKNNVFLGVNPKLRYNLSSHGISTGESTRTSFVFQFAIGYRFLKPLRPNTMSSFRNSKSESSP